MTKSHDEKVDRKETFLRLKDGKDFQKDMLKKAYKEDNTLDDVDWTIALKELKRQAGVK